MRWQAEDSMEQAAGDEGQRSMRFAQQRQEMADEIARELSMRSDILDAPVIVADFLYRDWSLVIAHARLTDKRGQMDPGGYLAAVTDLLWSVNAEAVLKAPARLFEIVPQLLKTLRGGLKMLGKEPEDTEEFFAALMRYHAPALRLRRMARDAGSSSQQPLAEELALPSREAVLPAERPQPQTAATPWMGPGELAAAGFEEGIDATTTQMPLDAFASSAAPLPDTQADEAADTTDSGFARTQVLAPNECPSTAAAPAAAQKQPSDAAAQSSSPPPAATPKAGRTAAASPQATATATAQAKKENTPHACSLTA